MNSILKNKNDIKIFILYLLKNVNYPLEFSEINDIVLQDEYVGYFDFADCFAELIDTKNISEEKRDDGKTVYSITEQGRQVADGLESDILSSIREKSLKNAFRFLSFKQSGAEIKCDYSESPDGRYDARFTINEHGVKLMQINIMLEDMEQLRKMKANFKEKPEVVYRGVMALLSGEADYLLR